MSIYYGSNPADVVTTITTNENHTISFDVTPHPANAYWFMFTNDAIEGDGVIVGPYGPTSSNLIDYWTSDNSNGYGNNTPDPVNSIVSQTFYFPDYITNFTPQGLPTVSYNPSLPTYLLVYGYVAAIETTFLLHRQQVTVTGPIVCFKEDSKILTNKGYKSVQNLRKGDLVKTLLHDYVPIDMIGKKEIYHIASNERIKHQLYKCSKDKFEEVFEDLVITGCHSILVNKFASEKQRQKVIEVNGDTYVTDKKYRLPACADDRTSVYEKAGLHTIYHLALENDDYYMNYGIYANGLLVETCSKRYLKELSDMVLIE